MLRGKRFAETQKILFSLSAEGGRLEKELAYMKRTLGEGAGSTHQIMIQTPSQASGSVLSREAMLAHLRAVQAATKVSVDMFDT